MPTFDHFLQYEQLAALRAQIAEIDAAQAAVDAAQAHLDELLAKLPAHPSAQHQCCQSAQPGASQCDGCGKQGAIESASGSLSVEPHPPSG